MNHSDSVAAIAKALSALQGELQPAKRDSDNPYFKSRYASLASCIDACRALLAKHGLAVTQAPAADAEGVTVTTMVLHTSGEFLCHTLRLLPTKADPQGVGSAITYGRRYGLCAALGIATDDDDGNAASASAVDSGGLLEVVPFGKNKGKKFTDLSAASLTWYADKCDNDQVRRSAAAVLDNLKDAQSAEDAQDTLDDEIPF